MGVRDVLDGLCRDIAPGCTEISRRLGATTSMQIYGLVVPFVLGGFAWLATWWNHCAIIRCRRGNRSDHPQPAE